VSNTSPQVIDRTREPRERSALADGALILLSPVLFPLQVFVGIFPVLAFSWVAGAIMLWSSRAWTAGQKLIGIFLSAASFIGISVAHVETSEPLGLAAAIAILLLLTLVIAAPAIVGVVYLSRRIRPRSARGARREPVGEEPVSAT
jgi:hypothetical protein